MKKALAMILAMLFIVSICSCGEQTSRSSESTTTATTQTTTSTVTLTATVSSSKTESNSIQINTTRSQTRTDEIIRNTIALSTNSFYKPSGYEYQYNISSDEFIDLVIKSFRENKDEYNNLAQFLEENYINNYSRGFKISYNGSEYEFEHKEDITTYNEPLVKDFMGKYKISKIIATKYVARVNEEFQRAYLITFTYLSSSNAQVEIGYITNENMIDKFLIYDELNGSQWRYKAYKDR